MPEIIADIFNKKQDGDLRVKWYRDKYTQRPYYVKKSRVDTAVAKARGALKELVQAARKEQHARYKALTRDVAQAGYEIYDALFFGVQAEDRTNAERAQKWVAQNLKPGRDTITFVVPSRLHIPWGLIYDKPPPAADELDNIPIDQLANDFWCMKYNVGSLYSDTAPELVDTVWPTDKFALLLGADQELWKKTRDKLDAAELQRLNRLIAPADEPKFELNAIFDHWQSTKDASPHGLLSFYCHSAGNLIRVGPDTLSADAFGRRFARREVAERPPTLVFLAGCRTAVGDLEEGFLEATTGPGFCGFIGTEALVPDIFTLRFMTLFLDEFFRTGKSVGSVIRELRERHWPLSLVFSMCCTGDLRLKEMPGEALPRYKENLSYQIVSSE
jgi:hypothetical protein